MRYRYENKYEVPKYKYELHKVYQLRPGSELSVTSLISIVYYDLLSGHIIMSGFQFHGISSSLDSLILSTCQ